MEKQSNTEFLTPNTKRIKKRIQLHISHDFVFVTSWSCLS